jgi:hypothetical protein
VHVNLRGAAAAAVHLGSVTGAISLSLWAVFCMFVHVHHIPYSSGKVTFRRN